MIFVFTGFNERGTVGKFWISMIFQMRAIQEVVP